MQELSISFLNVSRAFQQGHGIIGTLAACGAPWPLVWRDCSRTLLVSSPLPPVLPQLSLPGLLWPWLRSVVGGRRPSSGALRLQRSLPVFQEKAPGSEAVILECSKCSMHSIWLESFSLSYVLCPPPFGLFLPLLAGRHSWLELKCRGPLPPFLGCWEMSCLCSNPAWCRKEEAHFRGLVGRDSLL